MKNEFALGQLFYQTFNLKQKHFTIVTEVTI